MIGHGPWYTEWHHLLGASGLFAAAVYWWTKWRAGS